MAKKSITRRWIVNNLGVVVLALLVIDAEALVQVPVVSNALDLRPGGTGELLYPDWLRAHFEVSLIRLP